MFAPEQNMRLLPLVITTLFTAGGSEAMGVRAAANSMGPPVRLLRDQCFQLGEALLDGAVRGVDKGVGARVQPVAIGEQAPDLLQRGGAAAKGAHVALRDHARQVAL